MKCLVSALELNRWRIDLIGDFQVGTISLFTDCYEILVPSCKSIALGISRLHMI